MRATDLGAVDQLVAGLKEAGVEQVDTSTRRRAEYSTDASLYRVVPSAVVFPRSADEIATTISIARALGLPVTMRGAGTSVAGNAIGTGVVLDTSRHLNRIVDIDVDAQSARVEPGVILDQLQRSLAPAGLRFGPDPSTYTRCSLGGMIGNNACGSRALAYGRTADNVLGLELVSAAGERLTVGSGIRAIEANPLLRSLHQLVQGNLELIRTEFGRFTRQVSGYSMEHLLPENGFDVARFMVGTEGTLAVVTSATLRLVRSPAATVLVVLGYPDMATAADDVPALLPFGPTALEGMDARLVEVLRLSRGPAAVPDLPEGSGWLMLECPGADLAEAEEVARSVVATSAATASAIVTDLHVAARLWRIREDGAGLASRPTATRRSHAGWEDAAVPPEHLGAYLREFDRLLEVHHLIGVPYGHFGDGCVHVRLDFPLEHGRGVPDMRAFLLEAADLVCSYGGSLSGEHGDGRARSELLTRMYSPPALALMAKVKALFDPRNLLNPGIICEPAPLDADIRLVSAPSLTRDLGHSFIDDSGDFTRAVHRCTGVGKCRVTATNTHSVMCPSYMATQDEKDSTRGRARVLQEMINGTLVKGWSDPAVHDALDLCLACKGCASDCPTGVDMATYKSEALFQKYRRRLRPITHYSLGWFPRWSALATRAPRLVNAVMASPLSGVLKALAGIDARRALPRFAERAVQLPKRPTDPDRPAIGLWVDSFTSAFRPTVAEAAERVLVDAGYSVTLIGEEACSAVTWISTGQLNAAKRRLRRTLEVLSPLVADGTLIVGLEPSATAVLRSDMPKLLPTHPEAARVSGSVRTLAEVLAQTPGWQPPDLTGTRVLAQPHCHHHAVMSWAVDEALLRKAGASVHRLGGCCGLAGDFGMEKGHYEVSMAVAQQQLAPALADSERYDLVLADGFSCNLQIAELGHDAGLHLAELLDRASRSGSVKASNESASPTR